MFCTNCGHKNDEGSAFCVNCGAALQTGNASGQQAGAPPQTAMPAGQQAGAPPQTAMPAGQPYAPPPGMYAPPPQGPYGPGYPPQGPKKRGKGLIIGICVGAAVIAAALLLYFFVFAGTPVEGQWYSEELGEVLEFKQNGDIEVLTAYGDFDATYEYDKSSGKGTITFEDEERDFMVHDDKLEIEDYGTYQRADGLDIDEFFEEMEDELVGQWYSTELEEVLEFKENGDIEVYTTYGEFDATYEYDKKNSEGVITFEDEEKDFEVKDGRLEIEDYGAYKRGDDIDIDEFFEDLRSDDATVETTQSAEATSNNGQTTTGITGIWYDKDGMAGTLQLNSDGTFEMEVMGMSFSGTYTFDRTTGSGVLTLEFMGETSDTEFYVENGSLYSGGTEYIRDYVEQMDMDEMMDQMEEALEGLDTIDGQ